jgi:hypothetical protein
MASRTLGENRDAHTSRGSRITSLPAALASRSASSRRASRSSLVASLIKGSMHNVNSGSSVMVQQAWRQSVPAMNCGLYPLLFTEVLGSRILGSTHESQPILSPLSYIAVSCLGYKSSTGLGRSPYRGRYRVNQGEQTRKRLAHHFTLRSRLHRRCK